MYKQYKPSAHCDVHAWVNACAVSLIDGLVVSSQLALSLTRTNYWGIYVEQAERSDRGKPSRPLRIWILAFRALALQRSIFGENRTYDLHCPLGRSYRRNLVKLMMKLGTNAFDIVSMTTTYYLTNSFRHLLLHSSDLLPAAHMDIKLGTHAYYIISMTTTGLFIYY